MLLKKLRLVLKVGFRFIFAEKLKYYKMKKTKILVVILAVCLQFGSCSSDEDVVLTKMSTCDKIRNSSGRKLFMKRIKKSTEEIFNSAYEKSDNLLDIEEANIILEKYAAKDVKTRGVHLFSLQEGPSLEEIKKNLTKGQNVILEDLFTMAKNRELNFDLIYDKINLLPEKEQTEMALITVSFESIYKTVKSFELIQTRFSFSSFCCNLATGSIGTLYGSWAGALVLAASTTAKVLSGGVAIAVGVVSGALLSTVCC